jgi:hypothetical protein
MDIPPPNMDLWKTRSNMKFDSMILFCIANFNGNDQDHQIFPESGEAIGD